MGFYRIHINNFYTDIDDRISLILESYNSNREMITPCRELEVFFKVDLGIFNHRRYVPKDEFTVTIFNFRFVLITIMELRDQFKLNRGRIELICGNSKTLEKYLYTLKSVMVLECEKVIRFLKDNGNEGDTLRIEYWW